MDPRLLTELARDPDLDLLRLRLPDRLLREPERLRLWRPLADMGDPDLDRDLDLRLPADPDRRLAAEPDLERRPRLLGVPDLERMEDRD